MTGLNKATLIGNLGRDPETKSLNSGDKVVSFSIATSESWRDKATGERKEKVQWHNVVIFNQNLGKIAEDYLKKGSKVYLEGQIQTRKYADRDGNEKTTTEIVLSNFRGEIVLLGERKDAEGGTTARPSDGRGANAGDDDRRTSSAAKRQADIIDDDIPF